MPSRSPLPSLHAAALPLKDALRALRFGLRRARTLIDPAHAPGPEPLAALAGRVLAEADHIAAEVDRVASRIGRDLLDGSADAPPPLDALEDGREVEAAFGAAANRALVRAARYLGAEDALASETRAAEAFRAARADTGPAARQAARLFAELTGRRALLSVAGAPAGPAGVDIEQVAPFALVLWTLADRGDAPEDEEALLLACCDFARALGPDVAAAEGDPEAMATLIDRYADKV
jgi:hypothetical protein